MKQLTEDYVSYEIAKLLKEKGFKEIVQSLWVGADEYHYISTELIKPDDYNSGGTCLHSAPTHQIALKWLREVHEIHIDVFIGSDESYDMDGVTIDEWHFWTYYITNTSGDMIYDAYNEFDVIEYQSHEEAVEAAILYVLKNLI